jgi:NADPH-dependent ferric siderophore reductase
MGSRHRKHVADRVFIAGDLADVTAIQHILSVLPDDAYGQVYIEVLDERDVIALDAPRRVAVTWLPRVVRASAVRPLAFATHGEALATAIAGWVGEWMPAAARSEDDVLEASDHPASPSSAAGSDAAQDNVIMWIGCAGSARITALYEVLQARLAGLNALPDLSHHLS